MRNFAVPVNLLNISKILQNKSFKKRFNCVFWHPFLYILVKRLLIPEICL